MWNLWERGELYTGFRWGDTMEDDSFEDLSVDWRIILKLILIKWDGGMDWLYVAYGRDRKPSVENAVTKFRLQ